MSSGWKLVAALGARGPGYPHILVDSHGWCLRLGPSARKDDKYYSGFSSLLKGLVEQLLRHRLKSGEALEGVHALVRAVEEAIRKADDLSTTATETVIHEHIRRCDALGVGAPRSGRSIMAAPVQSPNRPERWEAVTTA